MGLRSAKTAIPVEAQLVLPWHKVTFVVEAIFLSEGDGLVLHLQESIRG
jgi:hypothetical protein